MTATRVHICARRSYTAHTLSLLNHVHQRSSAVHHLLLQPAYYHLLLSILARLQPLPVVQKVEKLAGVNLKKADPHTQLAVLRPFQHFEDISSCLDVKPGVLGHHGVGLSSSCLAVCKASSLSLVEDMPNQVLCRAFVHVGIGASLVEHAIKNESLLLHILGQVHLYFRLMHSQLTLRIGGHNICLFSTDLLPVERPLSHNHANLRPLRARWRLRRCINASERFLIVLLSRSKPLFSHRLGVRWRFHSRCGLHRSAPVISFPLQHLQ
mmetsp:Transcript_1528/g.3070  ORF Transcript_1528/g.3070 Transcript_1528/m.3070 type:complete len:267 (-) Transcript_1528:268-1068(-)